MLVQAGSVAEAMAGAQAGCDAVIAQGVEAGGHVQGTTALRTLIGQVAAAVGVPVIAAGGLADAAGVRAAIAAGAVGAMMGTRFVATTEADVHPRLRRAAWWPAPTPCTRASSTEAGRTRRTACS